MEEYYVEQAGNGYSFYQGQRYQRGHSWFGRLLKSGILPLIKYMGRKAMKTGMNVVKDVALGNEFKESAKKHIKDTVHTMTDDAIDKIAQTGKGRGRPRKNTTSKPEKLLQKTKSTAKRRKKPGRPPKRGRPKKNSAKARANKRQNKNLPDWLQ